MFVRFARNASIVLALGSAAFASTWTVDDSGGADFTTIQAAIDAAAADDTLLVMPGLYDSFVLQKPLRILGQVVEGQPNPNVIGGGFTVVSGIPTGRMVALANLSIFTLRILDSPGTVVGESLTSSQNTLVSGCADVRLRQSSFETLPIVASTVQLCDSNVVGWSGFTLNCPVAGQTQAGTGGSAVSLQSGALFAVRCSLRGGRGGDATCADLGACDADGGNGGSGLSIAAGAQARLIGLPGHLVTGGAAGQSHCSSGSDGAPGVGVTVGPNATLRCSGLSIASIANSGGTIDTPALADPMLGLLEVPHPGTVLTFRVSGPPGANAHLTLARSPKEPTNPASPGHGIATAMRVFALGPILESGITGHNFPLPATTPKGTVLFARAREEYADGSKRWTNSVPVIVR